MTWEWDLNCQRAGREEPTWVICVRYKGRVFFCLLTGRTVWVCFSTYVCVCVSWVTGSCIGYRHDFFWFSQRIGRAHVLRWLEVGASCWLNSSNDFGHEFCTLFWLPTLWAVKHLHWSRICDLRLLVIIEVSGPVCLFFSFQWIIHSTGGHVGPASFQILLYF